MVEVNGVSLAVFLLLRVMIVKSDGARSKGLEVISCAQLIVESFQLVLDLGVIGARSRV